MEVLKVSANSQPKSSREPLQRYAEKRGVEVQAVGAGAVNQSVKSLQSQRGMSPQSVLILCVYGLFEISLTMKKGRPSVSLNRAEFTRRIQRI